jgi:hypothetical protein
VSSNAGTRWKVDIHGTSIRSDLTLGPPEPFAAIEIRIVSAEIIRI